MNIQLIWLSSWKAYHKFITIPWKYGLTVLIMVYIHEYLEKMIIFDWIMLLLSSGWWLKKHIEKYEFVNGKDDIPYIYIYILWKKIKAMFQTTNQSWSDMVLHGFACKWNGGEFFGLTPPKKKVWNGWVKCAHYCWARLTWFSDELTRLCHRNLQPMAAHCFVPQLGLSKINRPTWLDQIKKKSIRVIIYG